MALAPGSGACLLPARSVPLLRPDLVDFSKLTKSNANYNLQRAFRTAEQHLGLARLLDPEGEPGMAPVLTSSWGILNPRANTIVNTPVSSLYPSTALSPSLTHFLLALHAQPCPSHPHPDSCP